MNNINLLERSRCTGCLSCVQICPHHCIGAAENEEGFFYPTMDLGGCTDCGVCVSRCPILTPLAAFPFRQECHGLVLKDPHLLGKSASGGAFAGIAAHILAEGGAVFGAAYDENLVVKHVKIQSTEEIYKLQGSKYVAGNVEDTYSQARDLLKIGQKVLFSGLPCQVAGLRAFLGGDYDNLATVDLICHGVPSQKLFSKYLDWLGKRTGGRIVYYGFRDKDVAGWSCGGKFKTKTKTKTMEAVCDPYYASFLRGETYRESCYRCEFSSMARVGDLTIGDFWGVEKFYPSVDRSNGVSVVLVNSPKGKELFQRLLGCCHSFPCKPEEIRERNTNLNHPAVRPAIRDVIYEGIDEKTGKEFFKRFTHANPSCLWFRRAVAGLVPTPVKRLIKRSLGK